MTLLLPFMAVLVALIAARTSIPSERDRVWPASVAFLLGWAFCLSAWLTQSPVHIIHELTGASIDPWKPWAAVDAIVGFFVFTKAYDRAWGISLFMLFVVQEFIHLQFSQGAYDWPAYLSLLNATFYLEVACLLAGGSSGIRHWAHTAYVRGRDWLGVSDDQSIPDQARRVSKCDD